MQIDRTLKVGVSLVATFIFLPRVARNVGQKGEFPHLSRSDLRHFCNIANRLEEGSQGVRQSRAAVE